MLFGAHVSIAGGVAKAPANAAAFGCECFQMFTRSPQGGAAAPITAAVAKDFLAACQKHDQREWVVHAPYYINLASDRAALRKNSVRILREELNRASALQAAYLMFHPGSARVVGAAAGVKFTIECCRAILDGYDGHTELLLEISAGAGEVIGDTFEELAEILAGVDADKSLHGPRSARHALNICFDTQHAFGSGYDTRTPAALNKTLAHFDKTIGLGRLKMSHCNDSKVPLGSHKDRHEHLGDGEMGRAAFAAIVAHPKLAHVNLYCETEYDKVAADVALLKKLRTRGAAKKL